MGVQQSKPLEQWLAADVAAEVAGLGQQYADSSSALLENGIDGAFLTSLSADETKETLDDLGIEHRLHRRVLEKKLAALRNGTACVSTCGSTSHCARSGEISMEIGSCSEELIMMSPRTMISSHRMMSPYSVTSRMGGSRMGDGTDDTVDHCRRRRSARRKPQLEADLDKSEILSLMATTSMQDRSERQALIKRQNSLKKQIGSLVCSQ